MIRRAIKAVNIILALAVIVCLALIARESAVLKMKPAGKGRAKAVKTAPSPAPSVSVSGLEMIAGSGAFGAGPFLLIEAAGRPGKDATAFAPSDVVLTGTVSGPFGGSFAVLQKKGAKRQELFAKGEKAFDLGVITAIEEDRVLVDAGGRTLTLLMPHEIRREAPPSGSGASASPEAQKGLSLPVQNAVTQRSGNEWVIDQRALQGVLGNMGKVLTDARLLPYSDNGKVAGFKLSEVKPAGVFGVMGLKNGDILLKVNDFNIDSPEKGVQLLNGLRGETSVSLDIIRGGAPQKLNYQIR